MTNQTTDIKQMFSSIAHSYDLLNLALSLGRDRYWRRAAVDRLNIVPGEKYIDIATGTGDMAIEIARRNIKNARITATDFSQNMIDFGKNKIKKLLYEDRINFQLADCESLPYDDNSFHSAVCAFGVRNFPNRLKGIKEMRRVIKEKGRVVILEFNQPENIIFKFFYYFYFKKMLPLIGGVISGEYSAYRYLPDSVINFYDREELKQAMLKAGLKKVDYFDLTFGIVTIHTGYK